MSTITWKLIETLFLTNVLVSDLSPPRKNRKQASVPDTKEERKTGLISGRDMREEIARTKKQDLIR